MCVTTTKLSEVNEMVNEHMNAIYTYRGQTFDLKALGWTFEYGTKRNSLGTCKMRSKVIILSKWVIENSDNPMSTWKNTMLHEIAHAIDSQIRGTSSHDWKWRSIALAIGCDGKRCSRIEHSDDVKSKYTIKCNNCGSERIGHKKSSVIAQGRRSCGKCSNGTFNKDFLLVQIKNY
jgi:hypothetical protein